jgi:hypothetical protein
MDDSANKTSFCKSIKENLPWKDLLLGLFIPLNVLYAFLHFNKGLEGMIFVFVWYIVLFIVNLTVTKKANIFAIITFIMILLNFLTSFFKDHPSLHIIVKAADQAVFGFIFFGSLLLSKPIILQFVNKETMKKIPEKIQKTHYFLRAWNIITAMWGAFYILSAVIIIYIGTFDKELEKTVDFCTGWPATLLLLIFSIWFPKYYWRKNWHKIEAENKQAEVSK